MTTLEQYYKFHSKIYDATRWSFLFGRTGVLHRVAQQQNPAQVLEVGCGTGRNLVELASYFPYVHLTGLDLSADMLAIAQKSVESVGRPVDLLHQSYDGPVNPGRFDMVLFSYSLSMINPGWETAIEAAREDLCPGGLIAVVDFHDSAFSAFKDWMWVNHVKMEGHLVPKLESCFTTRHLEINRAYGGVWAYVMYVGEKLA